MMDDNIVTFKGNQPSPEAEKEDMSEFILVCEDCMCTTFQVVLNGNLRCAECERESSEAAPQLNFARHVPENTEEIKNPEDAQKTLRFQGQDIAEARVVRKVNEWYKARTLIFAAACTSDAHTIQWTGIETEEHREWLYRRLDELRDWLDKMQLEKKDD
jgi:hypothetical protein